MAFDDTAVRDRLVDDDRVLPVQEPAQGGGDVHGVDALGSRGLRLGGRDGGLFVRVPLLVLRAARGDGSRGLGVRRPCVRPLGELAQGVGDVSFQIAVGEEDLVGDVRALRHLVDDHDPRLGRAARRRIEGGAAVDEEDEIGLVHPGADVRARVQRVGAREVAAHRRVGFDDREIPGLGEGDQGLEAARLAARRLGDDHRDGRFADQLGDEVGLFGRTVGRTRWDDGLGLAAVPLLQQDLQRDVEVDRSGRCPPGQFGRPRDHGGQGVHPGGLVGPLGERPCDAVRSAHDGQVAVPLTAGVLSGSVAVGRRLRGGDHHGDAGQQGSVDGHGALEQAGGRVQEHGLRTAGEQTVAGGHPDCHGLVGEVQVFRCGLAVAVAPGQGFPDRGPFRPRRAEDVVGADGVEGRYERFTAVLAAGTRCVLGVRHLRCVLSLRSASRGPRRCRGPGSTPVPRA